jgi:hypothetical protein
MRPFGFSAVRVLQRPPSPIERVITSFMISFVPP